MSATTATTMAEQGGETGFSDLHPDIIKSHILSRMDGPSLGCTAACSSTLSRLSDDETLWSNICHSTWPSTASSRLRSLISDFPNGGPRAFYSQSFPILTDRNLPNPQSDLPPELISAVDVHYKGNLIFTKTQETETVSDWFRCSPFRIDLLEPKDVVPTAIRHPKEDDECREMAGDMSLSWVLVDPAGRRAVNLSSQRPVAARRHWLTGEVKFRFATVVGVDGAHVQCGIVVTCGGAESGETQVREVSLEMEDMDGMHLKGKESLVFLQGALEGKKGMGRRRVEEGRRRYEEYEEIKRERRERKERREGALDMFCVAFGVLIFGVFCFFSLHRLQIARKNMRGILT